MIDAETSMKNESLDLEELQKSDPQYDEKDLKN